MDFFNPTVIFLIVTIFSKRESNLDFVKNSRLFDMINCVSSSDIKPSEIDRKCENSLVDVLAAPSAIFEGIETAHLLIWFVNPYISD